MRVVVAFDSFKGSMSAFAACAAAREGVLSAVPSATVRSVPMADGGEGTIEVIASAVGGTRVPVSTTNALGRSVRSAYLRSGDTAFIELAEAAGLPQIAQAPDAMRATTLGVGTMILHALRHGAREIALLLGGSATTDGGAGILHALGARLLDASGIPVEPDGAGLSKVSRLDVTGLDPSVCAARWRFITDVTNPLLGAEGSAAVFAPQKGASPAQVEALDRGLTRLAHAASNALGVPVERIADRSGAGAAGGAAAVLAQLTGGAIVHGSDWVSETVRLADACAHADLVLTGEGRFDAQSLHGKVVSAVMRAACATRVVVLAGSVASDAPADVAAFSIADGPASLDELLAKAPELLARAAASTARALAAS